MNYVIEAIFVGVYTVLIYVVCSLFIEDIYSLLIVVGFLKHFLAGQLGIHKYYCNEGEACKRIHSSDKGYKNNKKHLFIQSILEGFVFLLLGTLLKRYIKRKEILFFSIGLIAHISSELLCIHDIFCRYYCDIDTDTDIE